jgi:Domain of unknown function (DUF6265)
MKPGAKAATNSTVIFNMQIWSLLVAVLLAMPAAAQYVPPPATEAPEPRAPTKEVAALESLAWLEGCWRGTAGSREFREHWLPLRGGMLIGVSQTVTQDTIQGYEYLRLEARADGVYYVAAPSGKAEAAFRLLEQTVDKAEGRNDMIFTFASPRPEFPQRIVYRRASEGWLYATVEGKVGGVDQQVTYPMRRVDCELGEFIRK